MSISKKFIVVVICILLIAVLWISFYKEEEKNKDISLKDVRLKLEDLNDEDYEKFDEEHITESYIAPAGTIFSGWKILEKYELRFSKNESSFILQQLGKLSSEQKTEEMISGIKNEDLPYNFVEIDSEKIGEETYMGTTTSDLFDEEDITLYFIVFRINNIIVALMGSWVSKDTLINYAHIIENNIENELN